MKKKIIGRDDVEPPPVDIVGTCPESVRAPETTLIDLLPDAATVATWPVSVRDPVTTFIEILPPLETVGT